MPTPRVWHCPIEGCDHTRSRPFELWNAHKLKEHPHQEPLEQEKYRESAKNYSLTLESLGSLSTPTAMERAQRSRVPTAKAAESSNAPKQVDPKDLQIVTPEWRDLPTEAAFYEKAAEIPKINPVSKISSTTGEKIQLFHLGQHLESKDKFHYTRAKGDPNTGLFHRTEAPPYSARISDETHPICNVSEFNIDFIVSKDMLTSSCKGSNRTAKANVCAREGTWFYEVKLKSCNEPQTTDVKQIHERQKALTEVNPPKPEGGDTLIGAARVGFARREHSQGLSVGSTGYSYAVKCHGSSNTTEMMCGGQSNAIEGMPLLRENDVVGFMITLPSLEEHRKIVTAPYEPDADPAVSTGSAAKKKKKNKKGKKGKAKATDPDPAQTESSTASAPVVSTSSEKPSTVDIVHERYPIRAKGGIYYESSEYMVHPELKPMGSIMYTSDIKKLANGRPIPRQPYKVVDAPAYHDWPTLRGLPGSKIELWVNGKYIGVAAKNLLAFLPPASVVDVQKKGSLPANMHSGLWDDGSLGYYPAVSHWANSVTEFRFKEPFWFGHDNREGVRAFEERYDEQIVEDMVSDMIDEIGWEVEHRTNGTGPA